MERKHSIDLLRVLSAFAIIVIHIVSAPVTNSNVEVDAGLVAVLEVIHSLMNWAVPVFFMVTGYCLLKKSEVTYKYCFHRVLKYVCVLFTVGLFYALLAEIFVVGDLTFSVVLASVRNVISGQLWDHMWFVYEIIGIYLVMPVIHSFMQQGKPNIITITGLLFAFTIVLPTIEQYFPVGVSIPFGGYLFYVCFGGAMAKLHIDKKWLYVAGFVGLVSCVYILCMAPYQSFGYKHLIVCTMSMSIFSFFTRMDIHERKVLLVLSQCTWGVYLLHPFIINIALKLLKLDMLSSYAYERLSLFVVAVSLISFLATYVLRKIPLVKKLF